MSKRISYRVEGRVQGVFYRQTAQEAAQTLGITGFVTNNSDGTVSGEAQGDESALKKFEERLNEGSRQARVSNVEIQDIEPKSGEKGFSAS